MAKKNFLLELVKDEIHVLVEFSKKFKIITFIVFCVLIGVVLHFRPFFDEPIVITTNDEISEWYQMADGIKKYLEPKGVDVEILTSNGTLHNVERLLEKDGKVNVGYVIGPALTEAQTGGLYSLGSLDTQPVWIFYRKSPQIQISELKDLKKYRVGIGSNTSGSYVLTKQLMNLNRIDVDKEPNFISDKRGANLLRLKEGKIDVFIMVGGVIDGTVQKLLHDPTLELFNFKNAAAYKHLIGYYTNLTIPAGSIDIIEFLPPKDINLIAVTSSLVVRRDMHPGEQLALLLGANDFAKANNIRMYAGRDEYPAYVDNTIELSPVAKNYYDSGASSLLHYLPFKLAIFINRFWTAILALAFLGSLQITFSLSGLNIKMKITAQLKELIELDRRLHDKSLTQSELDDLIKRGDEICDNVRAIKVPVGAEREYISLMEPLETFRKNLNLQAERLKTELS